MNWTISSSQKHIGWQETRFGIKACCCQTFLNGNLGVHRQEI